MSWYTYKKLKKANQTHRQTSPEKIRVAVDDEETVLARILKGKLAHVDATDYAKLIVSKIRTTDVRQRHDVQNAIYHAKDLDTVLQLIR